jgi:hypothetical protein
MFFALVVVVIVHIEEDKILVDTTITQIGYDDVPAVELVKDNCSANCCFCCC